MAIYSCQAALSNEDTWVECLTDGPFIVIETVEDCTGQSIYLKPADAIKLANDILRKARRVK